MNRPLLTLRVNRRAIGAVVLNDEAVTLTEGKHLTSRPEKTVSAATRFVEYLMALTRPSLVVMDSPVGKEESTTDRIVQSVRQSTARSGLELLVVTKSEILASYGLRGVRNRRELRELIRQYWPELGALQGKVEPFIVDAAAAALYADCRINLERAIA